MPHSARSALTVKKLLDAYYDNSRADSLKPVSFGTSGHRGSSLGDSFNEGHILAISQAIHDFRQVNNITGPIFLGKDTHALSDPATRTALEVLAGNGLKVLIQENGLPTPTPVISRAILEFNRLGKGGRADGIVVTPSHNPPQDGGFKYNETHGGPAGTSTTSWIAKRANELMAGKNRGVKRVSLEKAVASGLVEEIDYIGPYCEALFQAVDVGAIASSGLKIGVDPMGGASLHYWKRLADKYLPGLTVVNDVVDPLFSFMPPDHDGQIRMDCSSPHAMKNLIALADKFDLAFANDVDADRHGIVTPAGLMNPNHFLAAAVRYLLEHRPGWSGKGMIGKTTVTTNMIDAVCRAAGRALYETPVGFKWFVDGLLKGSGNGLLFGGEESAGASFLRLDGTTWTTDKDGLLLCLLAAEMTAVTGKNPARLYAELTGEFGCRHYSRKDKAATQEQKAMLKRMTPESIKSRTVAKSTVVSVSGTAPGNGESIDGIKVVLEDGWFAMRPSGTEDLYKIYAESCTSAAHLEELLEEAGNEADKAFLAMRA